MTFSVLVAQNVTRIAEASLRATFCAFHPSRPSMRGTSGD